MIHPIVKTVAEGVWVDLARFFLLLLQSYLMIAGGILDYIRLEQAVGT